MKQGKTLQELTAAVAHLHKSKRDYLAETTALRMTDVGDIAFDVGGQPRAFKPTKLCLDQIGDRVGIPQRYLHRMAAESPGLLARNVNHWFAATPERRMLRTLDNGSQVARAFLSDKYRPLDNYDLMAAVLPRLGECGCRVESSEVTEKRLYIQAVTDRVKADVVGDVVQAGVVISNSEVGCGAINVEQLIWKLGCTNGMVVKTGLRRHHVGRAGEGGLEADGAYELLSDATRKLDDRAFWAKVNDVVAATLGGDLFQSTVRSINEAAGQKLGSPIAVVDVTAAKFGLDEPEKDLVLEHLVAGGDLSKWGLVNAVTRTAQDVESYDRAVELERIGGKVLELAPTEWTKN